MPPAMMRAALPAAANAPIASSSVRGAKYRVFVMLLPSFPLSPRPSLWWLTFMRPSDLEAYTGESDWNSLCAPVQVMGTDAPRELALRSGPQMIICRTASKPRTSAYVLSAARAIIGIFLAAALACCTATPATATEDLYRAQTVVTGQGEANRMVGFAAGLEDVLIKASGAHID